MKIASAAPPESLQWFRTARFGMFIHDGLYGLDSLLQRREWAI